MGQFAWGFLSWQEEAPAPPEDNCTGSPCGSEVGNETVHYRRGYLYLPPVPGCAWLPASTDHRGLCLWGRYLHGDTFPMLTTALSSPACPSVCPVSPASVAGAAGTDCVFQLRLCLLSTWCCPAASLEDLELNSVAGVCGVLPAAGGVLQAGRRGRLVYSFCHSLLLLACSCICLRSRHVTGSHNGWGGQGPLELFWSSPLLEQGHLEAVDQYCYHILCEFLLLHSLLLDSCCSWNTAGRLLSLELRSRRAVRGSRKSLHAQAHSLCCDCS